MKKVKVILVSTLVGLAMAACAHHASQPAPTHGTVVHHSSHGKLGKLGN